MTSRFQTGSRGGGPRRHVVHEARNFLCAYMKRNDPVSRRFIQYMAMQTPKVVILVRDGKTGQIIVKPPPEENWLTRSKSGTGRALKNDFEVGEHVGEAFFEKRDTARTWCLNFRDYYDVYIWDVHPGQIFYHIYKVTLRVRNFKSYSQAKADARKMLCKAYRFCNPSDMFSITHPILATITLDKDSHRARDVGPGDKSIYEDICDGQVKAMFFDEKSGDHDSEKHLFYGDGQGPGVWDVEKLPFNLSYNEDDALEDAVLFSEETEDGQQATFAPGLGNAIYRIDAGMHSSRETFEEYMNSGMLDESDRDSEDDSQGQHEQTPLAEGTQNTVKGQQTTARPKQELVPRKNLSRLQYSLAERMCQGLNHSQLVEHTQEIHELVRWAADKGNLLSAAIDMNSELEQFMMKEKSKSLFPDVSINRLN